MNGMIELCKTITTHARPTHAVHAHISSTHAASHTRRAAVCALAVGGVGADGRQGSAGLLLVLGVM